MTITKEDIQRLLTAAGYYNGRIDGVWGDQTYQAASKIVGRHLSRIKGFNSNWPKDRVIAAAAQLVLYFTGNEPGEIDGLLGHNTAYAFENWNSINQRGQPVKVDRTPVKPVSTVRPYFPKQSECPAFYGQPGLPGTSAEKAMSAKLVSIQLPFPFRIDWDLNTTVKTIRLHSKCAESAEAAYQRVFKQYGQDRMVKLGLDRFAGSYNPRKMRGGSSWSMHAYGCAIDTYAGPNGLHMHAPAALFSKSDYNDWFDIWEEFGWTSLGREIDRDYMHVQAARL